MNALQLIKEKRKKLKISQEEMAKKLNMARSSYQAIESGQNNMNMNDFFKIITILEIPINLFSDEELIIISKNDFEKLKNAIQELQNISKKIENNLNYKIQSENINISGSIHNSFNNSFNKK